MSKKSFAFAVLLVATLAGCKQGLDDRCQVQKDCESPYICNVAKGVCVNPGDETGQIDAGVEDASPPP